MWNGSQNLTNDVLNSIKRMPVAAPPTTGNEQQSAPTTPPAGSNNYPTQSPATPPTMAPFSGSWGFPTTGQNGGGTGTGTGTTNFWDFLSGMFGGNWVQNNPNQPQQPQQPQMPAGGNMTPWNVQFWGMPGLENYFNMLQQQNPQFTVEDLIKIAQRLSLPRLASLSYNY